MYNAENTSYIRSLTDAELEDVSGAHPIIVPIAIAAFLGWAIATDQPPPRRHKGIDGKDFGCGASSLMTLTRSASSSVGLEVASVGGLPGL